MPNFLTSPIKDYIHWNLAHEAWLRKEKIVKEGKSLMEKSDYEDKDKIKDMIMLAENCKKLAALI